MRKKKALAKVDEITNIFIVLGLLLVSVNFFIENNTVVAISLILAFFVIGIAFGRLYYKKMNDYFK
jgi:hypothetical protein